MFKSAVDTVEVLTNKLREKTDDLKSLSSVSNEEHKELLDLCRSFTEAVKILRNHSKEYDSFLVLLSHKDVGLPEILHKKRFSNGSFGDVYISKLKGVKVAVKMTKDSTTEKDRIDFENEIKYLRLLRHDNIVAYRGSGIYEKKLFVVMEFIKDTLDSYIKSRASDDNDGLTAFLTWDICSQIANGLEFLHSHEITHRDIKPNNILLDRSPIRPIAKLCDFGRSRKKVDENSQEKRGDVRYQSRRKDDELGAVKTGGDKKILETRSQWTDHSELLETPQREEDPDARFERAKKMDVFGFGLVVVQTRTGKRSWRHHGTAELESQSPISESISESTKSWFLHDIKISDMAFGNELGKLVKACCSKESERPNFSEVVSNFFTGENPYAEEETKGEFFSCGFLTNTNIFVADAVNAEGKAPGQPTYTSSNLLCQVDTNPNESFYPEEEILQQQFYKNLDGYKDKARRKEIDDNPTIALKEIITDRGGDDEEQKIQLKFIQSTYCKHRAMRDIWRSFDEVEKNDIVKCKNAVHKVYSTSFGLHIAILTAEENGKKKFVFTQRSTKAGMASPGAFTCGAVESCSILDYVEGKRKGSKAYVSLRKTAARGLHEELGLPLTEEDMEAIHLNTVYLKFDNHEWGMCGFVDLTDPRISPGNRFSFERLIGAFTSGPKDRFEHDRIVGVDFELTTMVAWIREHHREMASSGKIAVVRVLFAYFGKAAVTKEFEKFE